MLFVLFGREISGLRELKKQELVLTGTPLSKRPPATLRSKSTCREIHTHEQGIPCTNSVRIPNTSSVRMYISTHQYSHAAGRTKVVRLNALIICS